MKNQSVETKAARTLNANPGIVPVGIDNLLGQMVADGDLAIETVAVRIPITFSNYRVQYIAPNKPEHTFDPVCYILADDSEFGGATVRVFDVPDPDEGQRAVAQLACDTLNSRATTTAALTAVTPWLHLLPTDAADKVRAALALVGGGK